MPVPAIDPSRLDPATALLAAEVRGIRGSLDAVTPPPRQLSGWESLCAGEYAHAVQRLEQALADVRDALGAAIAALAG